jgi:hypothetical protein
MVSEAGAVAVAQYVESCDTTAPAVLANGVRARHKGRESKEFHVGFGVAAISRRTYQADGVKGLIVPLDCAFGVSGEYFFPDVREAVAHAVAVMKPDELVETMVKFGLAAPSVTAVRRMVRGTGVEIDAARDRIESDASLSLRLPAEPIGAAVVSMDGATAPVRQTKPGSRKFDVEYKMAMAGVVGVYGEARPGADGRLEMERIGSMGFARMPEERFPAFKWSLDAETARVCQALPSDTPWIVLMDGSAAQWTHVDGNPLYDGFHKLIDYYHASEHLHAAAEALFGKGKAKGREWQERWNAALLGRQGGAEGLTRSIEYHMRAKRMSKPARAEAAKQLTYFRNNKHRMGYAEFRAKGLPIGSGPVEACCKSLVKTRLCDAGMSWRTDGGQAVLTLRAYRKAGDWDAMWQSHMRIKKESQPILMMAA